MRELKIDDQVKVKIGAHDFGQAIIRRIGGQTPLSVHTVEVEIGELAGEVMELPGRFLEPMEFIYKS